jgi:hypothetical protein
MTKIAFGLLRFIELFSDADPEKRSYDSYIEAFKIGDLPGGHYTVIGSINGMEPVFAVKQDQKESVVVHNSRDNKLIVLANSREQFYMILRMISNAWKGYENEMFLPRTPENMSLYKQFIADLKKMPGVDLGYWADFAFKELYIR